MVAVTRRSSRNKETPSARSEGCGRDREISTEDKRIRTRSASRSERGKRSSDQSGTTATRVDALSATEVEVYLSERTAPEVAAAAETNVDAPIPADDRGQLRRGTPFRPRFAQLRGRLILSTPFRNRGESSNSSGSESEGDSPGSQLSPAGDAVDTPERPATPAIRDLTGRMASLIVSVDADEDDDADNLNQDSIDLTQGRESVDVEFPSGRLGFNIVKANDTWPMVESVKPNSRLYGLVQQGDLIDSISGWSARGKTARQVAERFQATTHTPNRIVRLLRVEKPPAQAAQGGGTAGTAQAPRRPPTGSAGRGRGSRNARGGRAGRGSAPRTPRVASRHNQDGRALIEALQRGASEEGLSEGGSQGVGANATRISELRGGRDAEDQRKLLYQRLFFHQNMVTPVAEIGGLQTSNWPKVLSSHILVNPYKPSKSQGGRAPTTLDKNLRDKKLVVLTACDPVYLNETKQVLEALVASNWADTEDYEVCYAHSVKSAMEATSGSRRRERQAVEETRREVSADNTPLVQRR